MKHSPKTNLRRGAVLLALVPTFATAAPIITTTKGDGLAPGLRKNVGDNITSNITVGNSGDAAATGVLFTDPDPANTSFVSVQSTAELHPCVID
jgi:uncharacterized repeat protein (TIGR01451 family)